jgi:lambda repressor-like predicted transcriptional regulator
MDEAPKKKKGRVRVVDVDREEIWKLARIGCTLREMSFMTGLAEETIRKNFAKELEHGQSAGKRALRRKQMEKAMEGSDRMLVWLGKQYLGQKEVVADGDDDTPLPWKDD